MAPKRGLARPKSFFSPPTTTESAPSPPPPSPPATARAPVAAGRARAPKGGPRPPEVVFFPTDHDRERALPGPDVPAGYRGVEHAHAPDFGGAGQLSGEGGRGGAHVDDEGAC